MQLIIYPLNLFIRDLNCPYTFKLNVIKSSKNFAECIINGEILFNNLAVLEKGLLTAILFNNVFNNIIHTFINFTNINNPLFPIIANRLCINGLIIHMDQKIPIEATSNIAVLKNGEVAKRSFFTEALQIILKIFLHIFTS